MNIKKPKIEKEPDVEILTQVGKLHEIILFNDDVNSFDHVIESLIKVCKHDNLQAEQCTWMVHYKGKCQVKRGEYSELEPQCTALLDLGITAEIE